MLDLQMIDDISKLRMNKTRILDGIEYALPVEEYDRDAIWELIEQGTLNVWLGTDENELVGMVTTTFTTDLIGNKSLLIYTITGSNVKDDHWTTGMAILSKYAEKHGAVRIVTFMRQPKLAGLIEAAGGDVQYYGVIPCRR